MPDATPFHLSISRLGLRTLGLVSLTLSLAACGGVSAPTPSAAVPAAPSATSANENAGEGEALLWSETAAGVQALSVSGAEQALSAAPWQAASSGWGPIERDKSNGERNAGDGHALSVGGKTYARGFGAHATSQMTFTLDGRQTGFSAGVGVDDEVGKRGSVVFQVYADGQKLFDSGVMRGGDAARSVNVGLTGKRELRLVVTDAGDGANYDHADWVNPTLHGTQEVRYGGPLVITKGGTYTGDWESFDPKVSAVTVKTSEPVVIENSNLRGVGHLITGFKNRLTVRGSHGHNLTPNVLGKASGNFIHLGEVINLDVENNTFEGGGIYLDRYTGDGVRDTVTVLRNVVKNVDGRLSDGQGGWLSGDGDDQKARVIKSFLQLNAVQRVPNVEIAWNQVVNEPSKSVVEDTLSVYRSSGTPNSPMAIHDNYLQGAYPLSPEQAPTYYGGGIMLCDGAVSDPLDCGYTRVRDNQVVATTNYGIEIMGGVDNQVERNRAVTSGRLADGTRIPSTNVGLVVWDYSGVLKVNPQLFARNVMRDNEVGWTKVSADGKISNNVWWAPQGTTNGGVFSNKALGTVTPDMERAEFARWQGKLASAGVKLGAPE